MRSAAAGRCEGRLGVNLLLPPRVIAAPQMKLRQTLRGRVAAGKTVPARLERVGKTVNG